MTIIWTGPSIRELAHDPFRFVLGRPKEGGFGYPQQVWRYRGAEAYHASGHDRAALERSLRDALEGGCGPAPWKRLTVPTGYLDDQGSFWGGPSFFDKNDGVVARTFDNNQSTVLVIYQTSDGGRTWQPVANAALRPPRHGPSHRWPIGFSGSRTRRPCGARPTRAAPGRVEHPSDCRATPPR